VVGAKASYASRLAREAGVARAIEAADPPTAASQTAPGKAWGQSCRRARVASGAATSATLAFEQLKLLKCLVFDRCALDRLPALLTSPGAWTSLPRGTPPLLPKDSRQDVRTFLGMNNALAHFVQRK